VSFSQPATQQQEQQQQQQSAISCYQYYWQVLVAHPVLAISHCMTRALQPAVLVNSACWHLVLCQLHS
jgi:hypothetical protein